MEKTEVKQKVKDFLKQNPAGVLSTVGEDSSPYSTTIYSVVDDDLSIYFLSKAETQKIKNIQNNNKVMFVAFETKTQTNVQVSGYALEIKDQRDQDIFKKILEVTRNTSGAEVPPISKLFAGPYAVYEIQPQQISYSVYNQKDLDMAIFETIDF
jgi:general stress protein 26